MHQNQFNPTWSLAEIGLAYRANTLTAGTGTLQKLKPLAGILSLEKIKI
jgi:hypothetical protein